MKKTKSEFTQKWFLFYLIVVLLIFSSQVLISIISKNYNWVLKIIEIAFIITVSLMIASRHSGLKQAIQVWGIMMVAIYAYLIARGFGLNPLKSTNEIQGNTVIACFLMVLYIVMLVGSKTIIKKSREPVQTF